MPQRVQASRRAGSRRPEGAVYVGRPSRWGNPHRVAHLKKRELSQRTRAEAVERYERDLRAGLLPVSVADVERELRGKDLVCWCPLDLACHADVLLRIANAPRSEP